MRLRRHEIEDALTRSQEEDPNGFFPTEEDEEAAHEANRRFMEYMQVEAMEGALSRGQTVTCSEHNSSISPDGSIDLQGYYFALSLPHSGVEDCPECRFIRSKQDEWRAERLRQGNGHHDLFQRDYHRGSLPMENELLLRDLADAVARQ